MPSGKQFTPDPGVYAEMSQIMQTVKPFSPLSEEGQGIAARLTTSPIIEAITPTNDEWVACETVQDTYDLMKRRIRAALTPSALSGDAGEVERLRAEVGEARREGAAMWRCGVSDTIILVDRVRRIFDRERGLKRNRALANLDAELEIALQDWFTHSRAARPNNYNEADAAFKDFSANSHLPAARKDTP